jgi:hypothetical protein
MKKAAEDGLRSGYRREALGESVRGKYLKAYRARPSAAVRRGRRTGL